MSPAHLDFVPNHHHHQQHHRAAPGQIPNHSAALRLRDTSSPTIPHSIAADDLNGLRVPRNVHAIREVHLTSTARVTDPPSLDPRSCYALRTDHRSMDFLLANESAAEQHVLHLLSTFREQKFDDIYEAFETFRAHVAGVVPLDFDHAEEHENRLWHAHTQGRRHFHRALSDFRKCTPPQPTAARSVTKAYLTWLKQSEKFYRSYIAMLNNAAGGIPELEAIAHGDSGGRASESEPVSITPSHLDKILNSCHRALIWLGDLSRYRATEKLDKNPDFGPAIGYYGLAASLKPSSGLGHHQQAVVALAQNHHLRAIYHLYRSLTVQDAHPLAPQNLRLEFEKTNAAWDKGELIQKRPPNDPDATKLSLVGWFVRFHSMCYRGQPFRGHEELEREVLAQLFNVVKQRPLDGTLTRMILVNIASQHVAGEAFQEHQSLESQQSFYFYFRLNVKTFTVLLRAFYDDLRSLLLGLDDFDVDLASKITPVGRRLLPCLRLYNNWLWGMVAMIQGLSTDEFVAEAVTQFWPAYARALDLVAQAFPIWDLEDVEEVRYLLEEDVETFGFTAFANNEQIQKTWFDHTKGPMKLRFSDRAVVRSSPDDEMLHRVKDFLSGGLNLASGVDDAPVKIQGTRIFCGDSNKIEALTVPEKVFEPVAPPAKAAPPKPVSYAAAAANGHAQKVRQPPPARQPSLAKTQARDAQLSRMVDSLLDEDDDNNPVTPPQPAAVNPAIVSNGELPHLLSDSVNDVPVSRSPKQGTPIGRPSANDYSTRPNVTFTPSAPWRPAANGSTAWGSSRERLHSVSKLWGAPSTTSSSFPAGLPTGTLGSPANANARGHSRVNSASSVRSRNSLNVVDSWASTNTVESWAPRIMPDASSLDQNGMASPLLFGAVSSPWSTGLQPGFRHASPPYGSGG